MPESLGNDFRQIDGIKNVDSLRYLSNVKAENLQVMLCIRGFTDKDNLPLVLKEGSMADVRRGLSQGEAVIGTVLANRIGKEIGR